MPQIDTHLVLSALGSDRAGIVNELSKIANDCGCNISDSRMAKLGSEFALIMMLSGKWDAITKFEANLADYEKSTGITTLKRRSQVQNHTEKLLPYSVQVIAMDNPGIIHKISRFFTDKKININDVHTDTYPASHTGTAMFSLNMTISVQHDINIAGLREQFLIFCDDLNLDANLELFKP